MAAKLHGQVWIVAPSRVLITDFRDYHQVLAEARALDSTVVVRMVEEGIALDAKEAEEQWWREVPEGAIRVV